MPIASWTESLGWMVLHSLWQGALLALALRAALHALPSRAAGARYALACACLAAMVALPVLTTLATSPAAAPAATMQGATDAPAAGRRGVQPRRAAAPAPVAAGDAARPVPRADVLERPWLGRALPLLAIGWLAGVAVLLLRLGGGWWLTRRLVRGAGTPPPEWAATLERLRTAMRVGPRVRLRCTSAVSAPVLLGCWRPLVLIPTSALTGIAPWQLELLLRHELAHVRRLDPWVNHLQSVAEVLLFHHPAARWVSACIRIEREHCCDDAVAADAGLQRYVHALVAMEELRATTAGALQPLRLGADGGSLVDRVRRLAGAPAAPAARATPLAGARRVHVAVGLLLAAGAALHASRPTTLAAPGAPPAPGARPPARQLPPPLAEACAAAAARTGSTLCAPLRARLVELLRARGHDATVVVQDVVTGALVAYAATSRDGEASLTDNRTPGSVWKLALAAIWWEQGYAEARVPCPATLTLGGETIRHWGTPRPAMTAAEMLVESCNTAAALMALALRDRLGPAGMRTALRRLGFPERDAMPTARDDDRDDAFWPGAGGAWAQRLRPRRATLRVPAVDDDGAWASLALGQAIGVSPLHIARFLQAIANDGVMQRPTVVPVPATGAPAGRRVMSAATAARLRDAMRRVVTDGTANEAGRTLREARWSLGGKTGTVPSRLAGRQDGWFAGVLFDDARAPRYVVVVQLVGQGRGGGAAAALAASLTRVMGGARAGARPAAATPRTT